MKAMRKLLPHGKRSHEPQPHIILKHVKRYPGDSLKGIVQVEVSEPLQLESLMIHLKGEEISATNAAIGGKKSPECRRTVYYRQSVALVTSTHVNVGDRIGSPPGASGSNKSACDDGDLNSEVAAGGSYSVHQSGRRHSTDKGNTMEPTGLMPGMYSFPFVVSLPCSLPPSLDIHHTDIRSTLEYSAEVALLSRTGRRKISSHVRFCVLPLPVQLHRWLHLHQPRSSTSYTLRHPHDNRSRASLTSGMMGIIFTNGEVVEIDDDAHTGSGLRRRLAHFMQFTSDNPGTDAAICGDPNTAKRSYGYCRGGTVSEGGPDNPQCVPVYDNVEAFCFPYDSTQRGNTGAVSVSEMDYSSPKLASSDTYVSRSVDEVAADPSREGEEGCARSGKKKRKKHRPPHSETVDEEEADPVGIADKPPESLDICSKHELSTERVDMTQYVWNQHFNVSLRGGLMKGGQVGVQVNLNTILLTRGKDTLEVNLLLDNSSGESAITRIKVALVSWQYVRSASDLVPMETTLEEVYLEERVKKGEVTRIEPVGFLIGKKVPLTIFTAGYQCVTYVTIKLYTNTIMQAHSQKMETEVVIVNAVETGGRSTRLLEWTNFFYRSGLESSQSTAPIVDLTGLNRKIRIISTAELEKKALTLFSNSSSNEKQSQLRRNSAANSSQREDFLSASDLLTGNQIGRALFDFEAATFLPSVTEPRSGAPVYRDPCQPQNPFLVTAVGLNTTEYSDSETGTNASSS